LDGTQVYSILAPSGYISGLASGYLTVNGADLGRDSKIFLTKENALLRSFFAREEEDPTFCD
jgi:hypothetical protein